MTLFTTLLVLIFERLFKLGEHWQLDSPPFGGVFPAGETFFSRAHVRHDHYCDGRDFFTVTRIAGSIVQRSHATGVAADWFAVYWRR